MAPSRFGGPPTGFVHPIVLLALLSTCALILLLPRKRMLAPLLSASLLIPMDQAFVLAGLHFPIIRILILVSVIKLALTRGASAHRPASSWNAIDTAFLIGTSVAALDVILLWGTPAAMQNQLGTMYTALGLYFLLRSLIQDEAGILRALHTLVWVSSSIAIVMTIEQVMHINLYAYVWPNQLLDHSVVQRDGHYRAMASFAHPLLAGTFGAICLPLFLALWSKDKSARKLAAVGILSSTVIVWAANSSTPLLAYAACLLAMGMWPMRRHMRLIRWSLVTILIVLHASMKAPVWALIGRIDITGSSSSYHRYQLVDQFIRHFGDWWLLGTRDNQLWGWDMWDLANQYVEVGETSGLLPCLAFLTTIVLGFKKIGRARKFAPDQVHERYVWALGAALFTNVVAFFGISYHDQTILVWYLLLAIIPVACASEQAEPLSAHEPITRDTWDASPSLV